MCGVPVCGVFRHAERWATTLTSFVKRHSPPRRSRLEERFRVGSGHVADYRDVAVTVRTYRHVCSMPDRAQTIGNCDELGCSVVARPGHAGVAEGTPRSKTWL